MRKQMIVAALALLMLACNAARQEEADASNQGTSQPQAAIPQEALPDATKFYALAKFPPYSEEEDKRINTVRCSDYFYVTFHGDEGMKIMFTYLVSDQSASVAIFSQRNIKLMRDDALATPQVRIDQRASPPVEIKMSKATYDDSPCFQLDLDDLQRESKPAAPEPPAKQLQNA